MNPEQLDLAAETGMQAIAAQAYTHTIFYVFVHRSTMIHLQFMVAADRDRIEFKPLGQCFNGGQLFPCLECARRDRTAHDGFDLSKHCHGPCLSRCPKRSRRCVASVIGWGIPAFLLWPRRVLVRPIESIRSPPEGQGRYIRSMSLS